MGVTLLLIAATVLGVVIAGGGGVVTARYVTTRWPGQRLPAFGYPNIHNWSTVRSGVPLRLVVGRAAAVVVGLVLIVAPLAILSPALALPGWAVFFVATFLPTEVLRRRHNRSVGASG